MRLDCVEWWWFESEKWIWNDKSNYSGIPTSLPANSTCHPPSWMSDNIIVPFQLFSLFYFLLFLVPFLLLFCTPPSLSSVIIIIRSIGVNVKSCRCSRKLSQFYKVFRICRPICTGNELQHHQKNMFRLNWQANGVQLRSDEKEGEWILHVSWWRQIRGIENGIRKEQLMVKYVGNQTTQCRGYIV